MDITETDSEILTHPIYSTIYLTDFILSVAVNIILAGIRSLLGFTENSVTKNLED